MKKQRVFFYLSSKPSVQDLSGEAIIYFITEVDGTASVGQGIQFVKEFK